MDSEEDGQRFRARVVRAVVDKEEEFKNGLEYIKFICKNPNSNIDEILTYNDTLDHIKKDNNNSDNDTEHLYKFRCITAH
jgi:spore coat polysaccharide biosynthesis protein SpsF (cytidylyltransferase family)